MINRVFFTIPLTITATLLHMGCCLLPLFSIIGTSLPYLEFFSRFKSFFNCFQFAVLLYLTVRVILDQKKVKRFCNLKDRIIHFVSLAIVITGMTISYY